MLRTTLLFAFVGPWLGSLAVWLADIRRLSSLADLPLHLLAAFVLSSTSYPLALLLGFVPAGVTGVVYAHIAKREFLPRPNSHLTNALAGAVLGLLFTGLYALALHHPPGDPASSWYSVIAGPGAFSGGVLAGVMTPRRPTHHSTGPAANSAAGR